MEIVALWIYCWQYRDSIFVRHLVDGKYQTLALSALPAKDAVAWIDRWAREGRIPARILSDEEIKERKDDAERKT